MKPESYFELETAIQAAGTAQMPWIYRLGALITVTKSREPLQ